MLFQSFALLAAPKLRRSVFATKRRRFMWFLDDLKGSLRRRRVWFERQRQLASLIDPANHTPHFRYPGFWPGDDLPVASSSRSSY